MRSRSTSNCQLKSGYTLLELMIVLAILVSIMSVAWPRIARRMQLLGPREAAMQISADLAEAREQAIASGQAWAFRIERGTANYEFAAVEDFRKQLLTAATSPTFGSGIEAMEPSLRQTTQPTDASTAPVDAPTTIDIQPQIKIRKNELPSGMVFDDGFAHSVSDTNIVRLDVDPLTTTVTAPAIAAPPLLPVDQWKFAVIFQPNGRATESEILLKEQPTENKIRLRIRGFTGGVTIDKIERKAIEVPPPLTETTLPTLQVSE